ncbi:hypothetical protein [Haloarcula nitratireducens]|uniref:Uncharacterized protein n=1 Tax=Haloarcula nitratireducens TaxID=2487749 RepID=A0AAW4PHQ0_9EURY|nr:hypothetical protein [Halomicroarcula nitratireducens]MBX0297359.1 hypothetical protein [Halomicroarcula nitratireducens]
MHYLCEASQFGIAIGNDLHDTDLVTAFERLDRSIHTIEDGYPAWHPAPLSFRAKEHVPIETVLWDREFDSMRVFQTLSNLDVNYLMTPGIYVSRGFWAIGMHRYSGDERPRTH